MQLTKSIETLFKKVLPSPFTIAILLTFLTISLAWLFTPQKGDENHLLEILSYWESGIWTNKLLVFAYQMMLILVLGHVLVLSPPMNAVIQQLTKRVTSTSSAVVLVSFCTILVAFFNWGLGLIFGAILARKIGEHAQQHNIPLNYPLVGAAGYVGLMVWHGGLSGSAPIDAAGASRVKELLVTTSYANAPHLPDAIPTSDTIFSLWNLGIFAVLLVAIPFTLRFIAKKTKPTTINLPSFQNTVSQETPIGADRLNHSKVLAVLLALIIFTAFIFKYGNEVASLNFKLTSLNFLMLGLCILFHGTFNNFLLAVEEAIKGTSGILIQFPLYFGIMGIMGNSGMVAQISDFFVSIANETTLPILTFFSAGLVNIFVPSGGGQWVIQGPIVLESALKLGVSLPKAIMALAYGDQITNMLQPFWALPLLGITKLKAKEILPYTLILMLVGTIIYIGALLII